MRDACPNPVKQTSLSTEAWHLFLEKGSVPIFCD